MLVHKINLYLHKKFNRSLKVNRKVQWDNELQIQITNNDKINIIIKLCKFPISISSFAAMSCPYLAERIILFQNLQIFEIRNY